VLCIAVGRVGLDRDLQGRLGRPRRGKALPDRRDRLGDAVRPPQRRRAAAEVDRYQLPGEPLGAPRQLAADRREIGLVRRLAELDREVAVRTALAAPREVEVDA
jgi:hypothetical protein